MAGRRTSCPGMNSTYTVLRWGGIQTLAKWLTVDFSYVELLVILDFKLGICDSRFV